MSKEISDNVLISLLVVAVIISVGGTFISLNRLSTLGLPSVTGASVTGNPRPVNYSIATETSIKVTRTIDFGAGQITGDEAILEGNASTFTATGGSWDWSGDGLQYILITNDGSVNVSLNVSSNCTAGEFFGGSNPEFNISIVGEEAAGACFGTTEQKEYVNISRTHNLTLCSDFSHYYDQDHLNVSVRLKIPSEASTGDKVSLLTFYADST